MTLKMLDAAPEPQIPIEYRLLEVLPSNYAMYEKVYVRKLTVKEVKQLASSIGSLDDIARIVGAAVKPVPFLDLAMGDLRFILAYLKSTTYKGAYWTVSNLHCKHCGHVNSKVIYDKDLQFKELDKDVKFPVTYDNGEKAITLHDVFRVKHQVLLEGMYKKDLMKEVKDNSLDVLAVLMIPREEYATLSQTPLELEDRVLANYQGLCELDGDVTADLDAFLDLIYFDVNTNLKHVCKSCDKDFDFELNIGSIEHFFPESQSGEHIREKVRFGV